MNNFRTILPLLLLLMAPQVTRAEITLPGLEAPVEVIRDSTGIPHIYADNEHDLFFMQGRIHAEDRLFQMDLLRRSAEGTLAEVLGLAAIQTDVETRTIGLGRAALRSLAAHPPSMIDRFQAYSDGVNSFLDEAETADLLPPEYAALGLIRVRRWEPLDSVLVGKALGAGTSLLVPDDIDLTIALGTYQAVGNATGLFDGSKLFFDDLFRSAPFDDASTVPDAMQAVQRSHSRAGKGGGYSGRAGKGGGYSAAAAGKKGLEHGKAYIKRIRELPKIPAAMPLQGGDMGGSNTWVIGAQHSASGRPMLANDMHLRLDNPSIFHEVHLVAPGIAVSGSSLPGAPCVVRGHNPDIAWGITNARLDITDIYSEVIVPDASSPSGLATLQNGVPEAIALVMESFSANINGSLVVVDNRPVLIVPRRSNGPLITAPEPGPLPGTLTALSVQSVGFGATRDPEGICAINRATNLDEFKAALQLVDFASQNFSYADRAGNIGYFISGELPLREDLQNLTADLSPPFLIRSGYAGHGWIPLGTVPPEDQATPFEILPFEEMPHVVNPPSGVIVNANNDQAGNTLDNNPLNDFRNNGGLLYLNWGGRNFSIRAGRESEMIRQRLSGKGGKISYGQMKKMQADTLLSDARVLTPYILEAYEHASGTEAHPLLASIASDPRIGEAVERLRGWDFSTPTGIPEGYDVKEEIDLAASVATTIYSTWRGAIVANSIDATLNALGLSTVPRPAKREEVVTALKHLLERDGVGVSGLNFFGLPGVDEAAARRDIVVLKSLSDALDLLASDAFAPAFANSIDQDDYRWGKLHRIVLRHPLGAVEPNFNLPPAFGFFPAPLAGLEGIPVDGGFETVDEAPPLDRNNVRVSDSDSFMFDVGPTGRFVARIGKKKIKAVTSLPGGESAVPGNRFSLNLLEPWLRNESFEMQRSHKRLREEAASIQGYVPAAL